MTTATNDQPQTVTAAYSMRVANTIREQLGPRFDSMTGAHHFGTLLPPCLGVSFVTPPIFETPKLYTVVELCADLYQLRIWTVGRKRRGDVIAPLTNMKGADMVPAENLRETWERLTGLRTSL